MAFDEETGKTVREYAMAHIADEKWHVAFFNFIDDASLAQRLGEEFLSARFLYKLLEGLGAETWLMRAQIRNQVFAYASIYEAVLHHILFQNLSQDPLVKALTTFPMKKEISIPADSFTILKKHLSHNGKSIIPTYEGFGRTDETKVRFDRKAECAFHLGIIDDSLKDDLIEFYEARNTIHIHAEIRKGLDYEIDLSSRSYRRMQPLREQITRWQNGKMAEITV